MTDNQWNHIADKVNFNLEIDLQRFTKDVSLDSRVLDFGCGYGRISNTLVSRGYTDVYGIDSSIKMIERGKKEFPELSLKHSSSDLLPYPSDYFDAVVACAVFTCITSFEKRTLQIGELYRVLKPAGVLHLVDFTAERTNTHTSSFGITMLHSNPEELRQLVADFSILHEAVNDTNTIGGSPARSYSVFARKALNEQINKEIFNNL